MNEKKNEKKYDAKIRYLIAFLLGIAIASLFAYTGVDYILKNIKTFVVAIIVVSLFILLSLFLINQYKEKIFEAFFGFSNTDLIDVNNKVNETIDNLSKNKIDEASSSGIYVGKKFFAWYSWKMYRQYILQIIQLIFVILGGIMGTYLLFIQNQKIENQNAKIEKQVYLEDASRRSNLILLMDNILAKVNLEITDTNKTLSQPLIGRIHALSQGFQPYYFLEDSTNLTKEKYSPERGQFLVALANSGIDNTTMIKIYDRSPFFSAYLKDAFLPGLYLRGVVLSRANLIRANLSGADLEDAIFNEANLEGAFLSNANLSDADFREANLSGANLNDAELKNANLSEANLSGAKLKNTNLYNAYLWHANLEQSDITNAVLTRANLVGANLSQADLRGAELKKVNLVKAEIKDMKVSIADWIEKLKEWNVKGHQKIKEKYKVVDSGEKTKDGKTIYKLKLKEDT